MSTDAPTCRVDDIRGTDVVDVEPGQGHAEPRSLDRVIVDEVRTWPSPEDVARLNAAMAETVEQWQRFAEQVRPHVEQACGAIGEFGRQLARAGGVVPSPEPADDRLGADPMAAAILAKRGRNTGPGGPRLDGRKGRR